MISLFIALHVMSAALGIMVGGYDLLVAKQDIVKKV